VKFSVNYVGKGCEQQVLNHPGKSLLLTE